MKTLPAICTDLVEYILLFQGISPGNRPDYETLKHKIQSIFDKQDRDARDNQIRKESYELAKFALVALVDETILNSDWEYRREWQANTLGAYYFNTTVAGEQFFTKLESLGPDETDILEIYYYCLCLGFAGKYKDDREVLSGLRERYLKKLPHVERNSPSKLTPKAYETEYHGERLTTKFPPALWLIIPAGVLILLYLVYYFILNQEVGILLEQISHATGF